VKCQCCQHAKTYVLETRALSNTIWRRRCCDMCAQVFVTQESRAANLPDGLHKMAKGSGTKNKRLFKPAAGILALPQKGPACA
jgi:transcriptional regulator NrdR family protein